MSYSSIAALGTIANLPTHYVNSGPSGYYEVTTPMPSAAASPSGITTGWVRVGGGVHAEYISVQAALVRGEVRRRTYQGESESVIFPLRDLLKMTAAAAIAAGLIDSAAAAVIATKPTNWFPFTDAQGDDNVAGSIG